MKKKFHERLRELRKKNRYTQKNIASDLGMTVSALSQYENGKRAPKQEVLIQLATYYNVSLDYLLGVDDNPVKRYKQEKFPDELVASSESYTYVVNPDRVPKNEDLNSSKARMLLKINKLPEDKQLEVLTAIELLLGTFIKD